MTHITGNGSTLYWYRCPSSFIQHDSPWQHAFRYRLRMIGCRCMNDELYHNALESLAVSLATPVISGRLSNWVDSVDGSLRNFLLRWLERRDVVYQQLLEQIGNEDSDLLPRVDSLRNENAEITAMGQEVAQLAADIVSRIPHLEPSDSSLTSSVEQLSSTGLDWLARVRKQDVAMQTWQNEAFNRDRGVGD